MRIAVAGGTGVVGRHVVDVATAHGHEVVVMARSVGIDLAAGDDLGRILTGTDVVIDVSSTVTQSARRSREFFGAVTRNLLAAERTVGVGHHVALSIVGSDKAPFGYYAGKAVQEELVARADTPWTILRATQFHEFARQLYERFRIGPFNVVPTMFSQPVAAREVAERLVALAETGPAGRPADLAGPEALRMVDMVRAFAAASGRRGPVIQVPLPGGFGRAMRDRTLLAGPSADIGTQTFADWLSSVTARS